MRELVLWVGRRTKQVNQQGILCTASDTLVLLPNAQPREMATRRVGPTVALSGSRNSLLSHLLTYMGFFPPCGVSGTFCLPSFGIFPLWSAPLSTSAITPLAHLYISFLPFSSTHVAAKPSDWWATEETMWMFSWWQELKPIWGWSLSSRGHNESTLRCWWHV